MSRQSYEDLEGPQKSADQLTAERYRRHYRADIKWLCEQPQFQRFFFDLLDRSGMWSSTSPLAQSHTLEHFEGRRALGLDLLAELQSVEPDVMLRIYIEHFNLQKKVGHDRHHPEHDGSDGAD